MNFSQCLSTDNGDRCVFGEGHKIQHHSDGERKWYSPSCCYKATEQLEVQLAGCGAAASGAIEPRTSIAKPGDYGWSASYQEVLELRMKYEALIKSDRVPWCEEHSQDKPGKFVHCLACGCRNLSRALAAIDEAIDVDGRKNDPCYATLFDAFADEGGVVDRVRAFVTKVYTPKTDERRSVEGKNSPPTAVEFQVPQAKEETPPHPHVYVPGAAECRVCGKWRWQKCPTCEGLGHLDEPTEPAENALDRPSGGSPWAKEVAKKFQEAVTEAVAEHHAAGRSVSAWRDGKVVEIPPPHNYSLHKAAEAVYYEVVDDVCKDEAPAMYRKLCSLKQALDNSSAAPLPLEERSARAHEDEKQTIDYLTQQGFPVQWGSRKTCSASALQTLLNKTREDERERLGANFKYLSEPSNLEPYSDEALIRRILNKHGRSEEAVTEITSLIYHLRLVLTVAT